jgi:toxin-antitoxin system PIN domain toxin
MKTLVDVNVVFAIVVERHEHHTAAWKWWESQATGSVGLCLPVRLGLLRLLTNRMAMENAPVNPEEALAAWDALEADERTFDIDNHPTSAGEICFRKNVLGRTPTPNLWTDALLAAWSEAAGYRLSSFDGGFRSFPNLEFEWLQGSK